MQSLSAILECCRQHRKSELPAALKALHCEFDLNALAGGSEQQQDMGVWDYWNDMGMRLK